MDGIWYEARFLTLQRAYLVDVSAYVWVSDEPRRRAAQGISNRIMLTSLAHADLASAFVKLRITTRNTANSALSSLKESVQDIRDVVHLYPLLPLIGFFMGVNLGATTRQYSVALPSTLAKAVC